MSGSATYATVLEECREALHRLAAAAKPRTTEWVGLDLTMGQLKSVLVLTTQGPLSVGELGRALGIGEPAASLLVDRLEERDLASRREDPADRRRTYVVPTSEATELAIRLRRSRDEQLTGWLTSLTEEDLEHLRRGLSALLRAVDRTGVGRSRPIEQGE
jgi:DNA-binding MarR family transcriptional regulator